MSRTLELAIAIKGKLDSSLTSAMQKAMQATKSLQEQINAGNKAMRAAQRDLARGGAADEAAQLARVRALQEQINSLVAKRAGIESKMAAKEAAKGRFQASAGRLGVAVGAMAGLGAALAGPIKLAAELQQGIANVGAVSGATEEELDALKAQAESLGASTKFTATEAAAGMENLARAGWDTQKIMAGMPGLLDLAAAGAIGIAEAADITAKAVSAFGLKATDSTMVANILARAAASANTDITMLGEAFKNAAPVAGQFGLTVSDTTAVLGLMGNAGIQSAEAGTALRNIIMRLYNPVDKAAQAINMLGIETRDADGNILPLRESIMNLRKSLLAMAKDDRMRILQTIFGDDASVAASTLMNGTDEEFNSMFEKIANSEGAAAEMAAKMSDTLRGQMDAVNSAAQGLGISIGNILLPYLEEMAPEIRESLAGMAQWVKDHEELVLTGIKVAVVIGGIVTALLALATAVQGVAFIASSFSLALAMGSKLALGLRLVWTFLTSVGTAFQAILGIARMVLPVLIRVAMSLNPMGLVITVLTTLAGAFYLLYNNCEVFRNAVDVAVSGIIEGAGAAARFFIEGFGNAFAFVLQGAVNLVAGVINALAGIIAWIQSVFAGGWAAAWQGIVDTFSNIFGSVRGVVDGVLGGISSTIREISDSLSGVSAKAEQAKTASIAHNAAGGIYAKGGFLTTFAENSPEAAIPLDGSKRAIDLWQQAGSMLGVDGQGAAMNVSFAPTINVSGGGQDTANAVSAAIENEMAKFERLMQRYAADRRRVAYA